MKCKFKEFDVLAWWLDRDKTKDAKSFYVRTRKLKNLTGGECENCPDFEEA